MYNNFSSKKTKKVISALLASALVVTSGPITADAATAKVVGIKKTFTVSASATNKVTGLSKAEKKVVKVTKKGKKFTIKGLKAGKATFKIGKKSYTVKVGATTVKAAKTKLTLTKGKKATLKFTTKSGNGDTLTFKASNKNVTLAKKSAKIAKSAASVKATAKKAGKTTITATSKATGKKATVTVTVKAATTPATATPGTSNTPSVTTGAATNTPEATATATATATASGSATNTPDVTATPVATATGSATATPVATGSATNTPEATEVPTEAPTKAPEVVTGGTITVTGAAVSGASVTIVNASGAAVLTTTATKNSVVTDKLDDGEYTISVKKDGYLDYSAKITVANGDVVKTVELEEVLKVASVSPVNVSQVLVKFNKEVNKTGASTPSAYEIKDASKATVAVQNAELQSDKKSVLLTIGSTAPAAFDSTKKYTVSVVKDIMTTDLAALTTALVSDTFTVSDATLPLVTDVKTYGNSKIVVTFNKPVNLNATIANTFAVLQKNGTTYTPGKDYDNGALTAAYVDGTGFTQVAITTSATMAVGDYSLKIYGGASNARDAQGIKLTETVKKFSVAQATAVAQVKSIVANSRTSVDVTFDSAVVEPAASTLSWGDGKTATTATLLSDNCTVRYTFSSNIITAGEQTFTVDGVTDAYGNTVPKKAVVVTVPAETVATASVKVSNDKTIVVTFSKDMYNTGSTGYSVTNLDNYVLKNSKGEKVTINSVSYDPNNTTKSYTATLKFTNALKAGTYTLSVSGIKDTVDTLMTPVENAVLDVKDTTQPSIVANGSYSTSSHKIAVSFDEAMATSGDYSITNVSSYRIAMDGTTYKALGTAYPTATITASADGKTAIIALPATADDDFQDGTTKIKVGELKSSGVSTVADVAGNVLNGLDQVVTISGDQPASINGQAVLVKDANSVYVATTAGQLSTVAATDFEYTVDGAKWQTAKSAELTTVNSAQYIKLGINETLDASYDASKIRVRTVALAANAKYSSATALGTVMASNGASVTPSVYSAKLSPSSTTWAFKTALKSATVVDSTHVRVVFDGKVGKVSADTGDTLEDVLQIVNNGVTNTGDSADNSTTYELTAVKESSDTVLITLENALDTTKDTIVRTAYNSISNVANYPTDGNGVYYVDNTTGITATRIDNVLAVNNVATNVTGTVGDSSTVTVKFTQAVAKDSIVSDWTGANATVTATLDANGKLTLSKANATVNFGEISGFTSKAAGKITTAATLALDSAGKALTLTFAGTSTTNTTGADILVNGALTYTPGTGIKTATGTEAIKVTSTKTATINAAPIKYSAESSSDKKTVVITMSEGLDASTVKNAGGYIQSTGTISSVSANGNKITVVFSTAPTGTETITIGTSVTDAGGNAVASPITLTASNGVFSSVVDAANAAIATSVSDFATWADLGNTKTSAITSKYTDNNGVTVTVVGKASEQSDVSTMSLTTGIDVSGSGTNFFKVTFAKTNGTTVTKYYKVVGTNEHNFTVTEVTDSTSPNVTAVSAYTFE